jgi:hypothetical protein
MNIRDELKKARKVIRKQPRSTLVATAKGTEKETWDRVRDIMANLGPDKVADGCRAAGSEKKFLTRLVRSIAIGITARIIWEGAGIAAEVASLLAHQVTATGIAEAFADAGEDFADALVDCWDISDIECDPSNLSDALAELDASDLVDAAGDVFDSAAELLGSLLG